MSKELYLIRYGAYGDHVVWSALIPYLQKKYDRITLETNSKGLELFGSDPRFSEIFFYEPFLYPQEEWECRVMERWDILKRIQDRRDIEIVNFYKGIEVTCLASEESEDARWPKELKAAKYGVNFYENHFKLARLDMPEDFMHRPSFHFTEEEHEYIKRWKDRIGDYFVMMVIVAGGTLNKCFPLWLETYCKRLIDSFPRLKIYLVGDKFCTNEIWRYERTYSYVENTNGYNIPIRQTILMQSQCDYVIGGDTGLLISAGMWGVPKTTLHTQCHKDQVVNYHLNDYSLQSTAPCSPCYHTNYRNTLCPVETVYSKFPICTNGFDLDELHGIVEKLYKAKGF